MNTTDFVAKADITITATIERVWEVLTKPELIKEYFFGTEVITDWQVGTPIIWRGEWQGKTYEDKGVILAATPCTHLEMTYWSSMSGLADEPENFKVVRYDLAPISENEMKVIVTQSNNKSEDEMKHSQENWKTVLEGMKKVVEKV